MPPPARLLVQMLVDACASHRRLVALSGDARTRLGVHTLAWGCTHFIEDAQTRLGVHTLHRGCTNLAGDANT
eukprot:364542-Chlamydomonas_euryale.AAC.10